MGHRHTKEEILDGAVELAQAEGLSRLTFGRVARSLGIADRTVVYYFPTKDDLLGEVLVAAGEALRATLEAAFTSPAADATALAAAAWPVLASEEADPAFALYFEASGLAAAGREPYAALVPLLVGGWIDWTSQLIDGPAAERRSEAEAAVALVDGLLLLRHIAGADVARRAAVRLGVAS